MDLATAFATVVPAERRVGFKAYDGSSTGLIGAEDDGSGAMAALGGV